MLVHYYNEGHQIKHDVEPSQSSSQISLVEHLLLGQLCPPRDDKQSGFKCEAADKIPEGWKPQILHKLAFPLNRKLEIYGEEDEVPD